MEYTVRFEGVIRAVSPLATNPPGTPEGRALPGQSNPPKPIPKATVLIDGTAVAMVPIFPGPGIRGTLRRKAVGVVRHALGGGGPVFLLDDHYYNVLGGVKGAEKEEKADLVAAAARRARNPIIGLFGAGEPWDRSRFYIGAGLPTKPISAEVIGGARIDDFVRSADALQLLPEDERARFLAMTEHNALRSAKRKQAEKLERELRAADRKGAAPEDVAHLKAELNRLQKEVDDHAQAAFSTVSVQRPLDGYEVIPAGTEMSHRMTLRLASLDEIGLAIAALRYWSLDPFIGAHLAHGCGLVAGEWKASVRHGMAPQFEEIGLVSMRPFEGLDVPSWLADAERTFMDRLGSGAFEFRAPSAKRA